MPDDLAVALMPYARLAAPAGDAGSLVSPSRVQATAARLETVSYEPQCQRAC